MSRRRLSQPNLAAMTEPNETLYLKNLNDSVRANELRRTLYLLCSEYGPVVDVSLHKNPAGRGQAWVTFVDTQVAVGAVQKLSGLTIYERPISVQYAKRKGTAGKKR